MRVSLLLLPLTLGACGFADLDDLNSHLGGLDFRKESRLFGARHQEAFVAAGEDQIPQAMNGASTTPVSSSSHAVWAVWGRNPHGPRPDDVTEWSGSLTLTDGSLNLARTLAFDRRDHVNPAPDGKTVSFESHTRPHVDGVVAISEGSAVQAELQTPVINIAAPLTNQVEQSYTPVDDNSIGVFMLTFPLSESAPCRNQVLSGRVTRQERQALAARGIHARAVGRWMASDGALVGHWRAFAGEKRDGTRALFGKVIDTDGNALAVLRGTPVEGGFHVDVLDESETIIGAIELGSESTPVNRSSLPAVASLDRCLD